MSSQAPRRVGTGSSAPPLSNNRSVSSSSSSSSTLHRVPSSKSMRAPTVSASQSRFRASVESSSDHDAGSAGPSSPTQSGRPGSGSKQPIRKTAGQTSGRAGDEDSNIKVAVRIRGRAPGEPAPKAPILSTSGPKGSQVHVELEPAQLSSAAPLPSSSLASPAESGPSKTYTFDHVFSPEADQNMVYQAVVSPVLQEVLSGYNCTIFAYGQTGTGKTHTMEGDLSSQPGTYAAEAGIIPRTLYKLFHQLELSGTEHSVHATFVELYNEELRDLLSHEPVTSLTAGGLRLLEDKRGTTYIHGLEEEKLKDASHGLEVLRRGSRRRQIAATKCNEQSSRSHSVFALTINCKETTQKGEDVVRVGKLNLVDLAGSESIGRSGAKEKQAKEAGMINASLLTLGRVINALVDKNPGAHVPYRESKLTRILQESLGGRTKTCIVATVSQEKTNLEETLSTLDYALRAKSIRNRPEVNSRMTRAGLIAEYVKEINNLKRDVLAARTKEGFFVSNESWKELHDESEGRKNAADELKRLVEVAESKRESLQEQFEQNMSLLLKRDSEVKAAKSECADKKRELDGIIDQARELQVALDEEIELREAYRNSEKKLNRVAAGLREQAEEAQGDIGGLFAKLERKAKVEETNQQVITGYRKNFDSVAAHLEGQTRKFSSAHDAFSAELAETLQSFSDQETQAMQQSQDEAAIQLQTLSELATKLAAQQAGSHETVSDLSRKIQASSAELLRVHQSHTSSVRNSFDQVRNALLERQGTYTANAKTALHSLSKVVTTMCQQTQAHVEDEKAKIAAAQTFAEEASQREIARLQEQNALLTSMLHEQREKEKTMGDALSKSIADLLMRHSQDRDRSLSEAVDSVQTKISASEADAHAFVAGHSQQMAALTDGADAHWASLESSEKDAKKYRKRVEAALGDATDKTGPLLEAYEKDMASDNSEANNKLNGLVDGLSSDASAASEQAESSRAAHASHLDSISSATEALNSSVLARLSTSLENIGSLAASTSSKLDLHREAGMQYLQGTSTSLAKLQKETNNALTQRYAQDIPTGLTPQKKEWVSTGKWPLVPSDRNVALGQFRHLKERKAAMLQQERALQAGERRLEDVIAAQEAGEVADFDGTIGTLPDDSRATVDVEQMYRQHVDVDVEGELHINGDDDFLDHADANIEGQIEADGEGPELHVDDNAFEDSLDGIVRPASSSDSDATIRHPPSLTKPSGVGRATLAGPPVSSNKTRIQAPSTTQRHSTAAPPLSRQSKHGRVPSMSSTAPPLVEKSVNKNSAANIVASTVVPIGDGKAVKVLPGSGANAQATTARPSVRRAAGGAK